MGKAKKPRLRNSPSNPFPSKKLSSFKASTVNQKAVRPPPIRPPTIPFNPSDRVLLVGEGDFSFSRALLEHHGIVSLVPTCYDSESGLVEKYPQATDNITALENEDDVTVLYSIDATKLGKAGGGGKEIRKGAFDRIVFNFPHVGGLTKDVNRQVRYNQELLVGFFKSAIPLMTPAGSIIVTVFEGEPYELWNIRDLARHVGLKVGRSFKFQADAYHGYKHARTLGNIEGGRGWKGEDRAARTYVFETRDGEKIQTYINKRNREESDDEN